MMKRSAILLLLIAAAIGSAAWCLVRSEPVPPAPMGPTVALEAGSPEPSAREAHRVGVAPSDLSSGPDGSVLCSNGTTGYWCTPTGAGWQTIWSLDLTAAANYDGGTSQVVSSDGNFTYAGYTWSKINSANEVTHATFASGVGLTIQPTSATDYDTAETLPSVWLALSQLGSVVPSSFGWDTPLRVYVSFTHNAAAIYDDVDVAIDHNDTFATFAYISKYGYGTSSNVGVAVFLNANSSNVQQANGASFVLSSPAMLIVTLPEGLQGGEGNNTRYDAGAAAWPTPLAMGPGARSVYQTGSASFLSYVSGTAQPTDWGIRLGAQRAGSATSLSVTFTNIRLDVHL